jgi:dynein heavy chain
MKYTDVLKSYRKELVVYRELFNQGRANYEEGKANLVISRGKPPIAGIISWSKSLMQRMKTPIVKFNKNEDKF